MTLTVFSRENAYNSRVSPLLQEHENTNVMTVRATKRRKKRNMYILGGAPWLRTTAPVAMIRLRPLAQTMHLDIRLLIQKPCHHIHPTFRAQDLHHP